MRLCRQSAPDDWKPSKGFDGQSEHRREVVLHADHGPAEFAGLGEGFLRAVVVGEFALAVVVVNQQPEASRLKHRGVAVRVTSCEQGFTAGASPDVHGLAWPVV